MSPLSAMAQLIPLSLPASTPRSTNPAAIRMKQAEQKGQWAECSKQARMALPSSGIAKSWIHLSWVRCSFKNDQARASIEELPLALRAWTMNAAETRGPWDSEAQDLIPRARFWLAERSLKTQLKLAEEQVLRILEEAGSNDKKSRARAWSLLGEISQSKRDLEAAVAGFEQSLLLQEDREVRQKYEAALLALGSPRKASGKDEDGANSGNGNVVSESEPRIGWAQQSAKEIQFQERFDAAEKAASWMQLLDDCVAYLKAFPSGARSRWAYNKILEIHQRSWDSVAASDDVNRRSIVMDRVTDPLTSLDGLRAADLAPVLFRRGDYRSSLKVAEAAMYSLEGTRLEAEILWWIARSAQLTGDFKKSLKAFERILVRHLGDERIGDAHLQAALIHLRNRNPSSASALLERMLATGAEKHELAGRYWLIRALQAQNNPRAADEIQKLLAKFPLTYYGIRLTTEASQGQFAWPSKEKSLASLKGKVFLTAPQKRSWDRMQWLRAHGWMDEAQIEARSLPLSSDPELKVLWSQELERVGAFSSTIRLINEAGDRDPRMRSLDVLRLALPQIFREQIEKEAQSRQLSPFLVRALIRQESGFQTKAVSSSNALGLMQLIPPTANEVAAELRLGKLEIPEDVFDPEINIRMGTSYIAKMIRQFGGSVPVGLAAYNAGPHRLRMFLNARPEIKDQILAADANPLSEIWFDELPWSETSFYVKAILRNTVLFRSLDQSQVQFGGVLWQDLLVASATNRTDNKNGSPRLSE